jgi:molybdopterin-guanine dinucleotide biosynthesis protein A
MFFESPMVLKTRAFREKKNPSAMKDILGIVLCGGKSKRMGSDKGLKKIDDKTWAEHIGALFIELDIPFVVSVNAQQIKNYSEIFDEKKLVPDSVAIPSALRGVLSVYERFPDKNLLPVACDLIRMDTDVMTGIINAYLNNNRYDFYVYQLAGNDFAEPFAGIYTRAGLQKVDSKYRNDELLKYSFQNIFDSYKTLRITTDNAEAFSNINK